MQGMRQEMGNGGHSMERECVPRREFWQPGSDGEVFTVLGSVGSGRGRHRHPRPRIRVRRPGAYDPVSRPSFGAIPSGFSVAVAFSRSRLPALGWARRAYPTRTEDSELDRPRTRSARRKRSTRLRAKSPGRARWHRPGKRSSRWPRATRTRQVRESERQRGQASRPPSFARRRASSIFSGQGR